MHPSSHAAARSTALALSALCVLLPVLLAGCDSDDPDDPDPQQSQFVVRYELTGTCFGIRSVAYNVTSGTGSNSGSGTFELPWSFQQTVTATMSPTATAMSATCVGANGAAQTLTGRILVDGQERAMQTNAGTTQISVTLSTLLR
jgi:hypothetical protein